MAKKPYPSEVLDRYIVRFPAGMRDRIALAAEKNGRSMNSEILARIAYTFEKDIEDWALGGAADDMGGDKYDQIAQMIIRHLDKHFVEKHLVFQRIPSTGGNEPGTEPTKPRRQTRTKPTTPAADSETTKVPAIRRTRSPAPKKS